MSVPAAASERNGRRRVASVPAGGPFGADLKVKDDALVAAGKPAKVALVAITRKLIVLADTLLRDRRSGT